MQCLRYRVLNEDKKCGTWTCLARAPWNLHIALSRFPNVHVLFHLRWMAATARIALRMRCDAVTWKLDNSQRILGYKVALEESMSKKRLRCGNKRILLARVDISISL